MLALPTFQRFAFVLVVLERYSEREAAILLENNMAQVHAAWVDGLAAIMKANKTHGTVERPVEALMG